MNVLDKLFNYKAIGWGKPIILIDTETDETVGPVKVEALLDSVGFWKDKEVLKTLNCDSLEIIYCGKITVFNKLLKLREEGLTEKIILFDADTNLKVGFASPEYLIKKAFNRYWCDRFIKGISYENEILKLTFTCVYKEKEND